MSIQQLLLLFAAFCFLIGVVWGTFYPNPPNLRINPVALGLLFWVVALIVGGR